MPFKTQKLQVGKKEADYYRMNNLMAKVHNHENHASRKKMAFFFPRRFWAKELRHSDITKRQKRATPPS